MQTYSPNSPKLVLITGVAGFIGGSLALRLIQEGFDVVGIDNLNNYYEVSLKVNRLKNISSVAMKLNRNFIFEKVELADKEKLTNFLKDYKFDYIFHFAAQAGVRNSFEDPQKYFDFNILGTYNLLESTRNLSKSRLFFASTSSVYGNSKQNFFSENQELKPIQFYATTKLVCENILESYALLFDMNVTTFRFFTVYGPFGRPDMAINKFVDSIFNGKEIEVYNYGNHSRSFTYIDDVIHYLVRAIELSDSFDPGYSVYNLGNPNTTTLEGLIEDISLIIGNPVRKKYLPLQKGDIFSTAPNIDKIVEKLGKHNFVDTKSGLICFVEWYKQYYLNSNQSTID